MKGTLGSDVHNTEFMVMVKTSFPLASPAWRGRFQLREGAKPSPMQVNMSL